MRSRLFFYSISMVSVLLSSYILFSMWTTTPEKNISSPLPDAPSLPNIRKTIATNQWYSNIYESFPTQPLYALPGAYRITQSGLQISVPKVSKQPNTISAPFSEDFTVGYGTEFKRPQIKSIGDWSIAIALEDAFSEKISFTLAHGIPSTTIHAQTDKEIQISFPHPFEIYLSGKDPVDISKTNIHRRKDLLLVTNNNAYILVFDTESTISLQSNSLHIKIPHTIYIGMLGTKEQYQLFLSHAQTDIVDTEATFSQTDTNTQTIYTIHSPSKPLIALYPHQYDTLKSPLTILGTYQTIRGTMNLVETDQFTTTIPSTIPFVEFPPLSEKNEVFHKALDQDIKIFLASPPPASEDYFLGTWFGKGISLLQLANNEQVSEPAKKLQNLLEKRLTHAMDGFYYDKEKQGLIAKKPEFGNEKMNDHHFHYAYFIRAAAILSMHNPSFLSDIQEPIARMVEDIATTDKTSEMFPYLRNFDIYESHSWADGYAHFSDGNNQESSSEAIQAWYSIYLWGVVTKNESLTKLGISLYNQEIRGTQYYWFGKNNLYSDPYQHTIASLIWGGKVDFATWFSPETNIKYGIQILPLTPASMYIGTIDAYDKHEKEISDNDPKLQKEWGDLLLVWKSFFYPEQALDLEKEVKSTHKDTPRSLLLYFLLHNLETKKKS